MDFAAQEAHRVKVKESKKLLKYRDLARELRKAMEHESDSDNICSQCLCNSLFESGKENQ